MNRFTPIKAQLDTIDKQWTDYATRVTQRIQYARELLQKAHELLPTNPVEADRCLSSAIVWLEDT
jgi:hypothetical protein